MANLAALFMTRQPTLFQLNAHRQRIQMTAAIDLRLVVRRQVFKLEDLLFSCEGKTLTLPDNQHIAAASADAIHVAHGPRGSRAAGASDRGYDSGITGSASLVRW